MCVRQAMRNESNRRRKKEGCFNNFAAGELRSRDFGFPSWRGANYVGALQGHAGGEVPLVLTTQRADRQRRQPRRAGVDRAVSWGGGRGGGTGPASRTGLPREP